jgi:hypothetical protein
MTVYVDDAKNEFRGMIMSHMIADTVDELHQMADDLGLFRAWYQPKSFPHYDVTPRVSQQAIRLGAIAVTQRELVEVIRRCRGEG